MPKRISKLDFVQGTFMTVPNQWQEPVTDQPVHEDLEEILWINKDFPCIDGCWIAQVWGTCQHLAPTWYLYLDFDPNPYGVTISELCND